MMMIKNQTNFLICSVIVVGLLFEWANKSLISPNTDFLQFYTISSTVRAVLMIYAACIAYWVRGSFLLWLFMAFNLSAILLNILYLAGNYYLIHDLRQIYFAPLYRYLEVIILLWTGPNALSHLYHIVGVIRHRLGFVVARRRIHAKAKVL